MNIILRKTPIWFALALFVCLTLGIARAQSPDPKFDPVFAEVKKIEASQPDKALSEYDRIKKESKDAEVGAEALLRSALFASSPEYGKTEDLKVSGENTAHQRYKDLLAQYAQTKAAQTVKAQKLQDALEQRIDQRNSHYFSYQLVDKIVALTGRIPALSYWLALTIIALIVKTITFPLTLRMYKSQREMQRIQPVLKELQEQYKDDKVKLNEHVMKAYKEHGINPLASCFPLLIQMPFLFWVYNTIRLYEFHFSNGGFLWIGSALSHKYPEYLGTSLGHFDLILLILYATSNYLTMRLTPASDPQAAQTQKTTAVMMTLVMFWVCMTSKWSAAFIFYWLVLNFISAFQQYKYIYMPNKNNGAGGAGGAAVLLPATAKSGSPGNGNGSGSISQARPVNPVPNETMRPRPRRKKR